MTLIIFNRRNCTRLDRQKSVHPWHTNSSRPTWFRIQTNPFYVKQSESCSLGMTVFFYLAYNVINVSAEHRPLTRQPVPARGSFKCWCERQSKQNCTTYIRFWPIFLRLQFFKIKIKHDMTSKIDASVQRLPDSRGISEAKQIPTRPSRISMLFRRWWTPAHM